VSGQPDTCEPGGDFSYAQNYQGANQQSLHSVGSHDPDRNTVHLFMIFKFDMYSDEWQASAIKESSVES